jgi:hypothetical protein
MRRIETGAAVLLATTRCPADRGLRDLPGAGAGLDAVRTGLAADPRGFSPGRIYVLDPTQSPEQISASFGAVVAAATGPIVVYLGGHLLADPRTHSLHLALAGSRRDTVRYTGLPLEWVTNALRGDGGRLAIVFLDVVWHPSAIEAVRRPRSRAAAELRPDGVLVIAAPMDSARAALAAARRGRPMPFGRDLAAGLRVGVEGWLRVHAGSVAMPAAVDAGLAEPATVGPLAGPRFAGPTEVNGPSWTGRGRAAPAHALPVASRGPLYRQQAYRPRHALPSPPGAIEQRTEPVTPPTWPISADEQTSSVLPGPAGEPPLAGTPDQVAAAPAAQPAQAQPTEDQPPADRPESAQAEADPAADAPTEPTEPTERAEGDAPVALAERRERAHEAWQAGDHAHALRLLRELVAELDQPTTSTGAGQGGDDQPAAATEEAFSVRELLAHCVGEDGAPAEAAARFRDVCQDRLRESGPEHPASLQALDNFHIWWRRTPVSSGLPLAADLVRLRTRINGADHPATRAARQEAEEAAALVGSDPSG